tara:strand:+ start:306 stop:746 length:441 start_codon:yes stop_codon:yes gene_type:complete
LHTHPLFSPFLSCPFTHTCRYNSFAPHLKKQPGCTAAERESFGEWLESSGRVDALRALHGDADAQYSYWSTRAQGKAGNKGLRLDYFLVKGELIEEADAAAADATTDAVRVHSTSIAHLGFGGGKLEAPSDHAPIVLTLSLTARQS